MKVYVAGKISGKPPYQYVSEFRHAASILKIRGFKVINPVTLNSSLATQEFDYEDMMKLCFAAIDVCDAIYMLEDWSDSPGARREHEYALNKGKKIIYQTVERMAANA